MGIIGLVILSLAFGAVHSSKCEPDTVVCAHHWVKMEPHKNLMEAEEELDSWCRKQSLFFRCLDPVLFCRYGNYSKFPTDMLVSKMFSEDLCLKGSPSRKRYLDNAACINQLDFEHCTMPEYLEIVTPDTSVPPKCSSDKTFSCIATTLVMKCGLEAGEVFRHLLKVSKYDEEVCDQEGPEETTCREDCGQDRLSKMYDGNFRRFGFGPEPDVIEYTTISGVIKNALYGMEADFSSERSTLGDNEASRSRDQFRKRPVITEPFKGLLFYNYSNQKFEFYWRQPGSFPVDRVTCEHLVSSEHQTVMLLCDIHYRFQEPECTKPAEENEDITPELIRDIDLTIPADSTLTVAESDWTGDLIDYKRHRLSWPFYFSIKGSSETDEIREVNKYYLENSPNSDVCGKQISYYDIIHEDYIDWWQCPSLFSDALRNEILTFLSPNRNSNTSEFILTTNIASDANGKNKTQVLLFEPLFHGFDKIACSSVNECHPRGRGMLKCSMERRSIESCDSCCVPFPQYAKMCTKKIAQSKEVDDKSSEVLNSPEEGSGSVEDESPEVTFMVSDELSTNPDEPISFVTGVVDENGDLVAVDLSDLTEDSNNDVSSDVKLAFLRPTAVDGTEDPFVAQPEDPSEEPLDKLSELRVLHNNFFVLQTVPSVADIEAAYEIIESEDGPE